MSHILSTKINKIHEAWATANGYRPQAPSLKLRSTKLIKVQAASFKPQAASVKLKATSRKLPDP